MRYPIWIGVMEINGLHRKPSLPVLRGHHRYADEYGLILDRRSYFAEGDVAGFVMTLRRRKRVWRS